MTVDSGAARPRRAGARQGVIGPPLERAQLVWQRAVSLAHPVAEHDRFASALDLLRTAHHSPSAMAHALTLGRNHMRAHPEDALARRAIAILKAATGFLGIKPRADEIGQADR